MAKLHVNGIELSWRERGDGPPLLLIHGTGCTGATWDGVAGPLSERFRVITYDRRGFGASEAPPLSPKGYFVAHSADASGLLRALGIDRAVVVGSGGGGLAALHLALNHPEQVSDLVLAEPPLHARRHPTLSMMRAFASINLQAALGPKRAATETFLRWATGYTTGGCGFDKLDAASHRLMLDQAEPTLLELQAGTGEELTPAMISSLRMPVTCLVGGLTQEAISSATMRLGQLLPRARVVTIPGAGHLLHVDQPQRFIRAVNEAGPEERPERVADEAVESFTYEAPDWTEPANDGWPEAAPR
jgi:pimeloyl-ACP methyl ester carboxylesterase